MCGCARNCRCASKSVCSLSTLRLPMRGGKIVSHCQGQGRTIHAIDAFLAAAAEVHKLTLVTHNVPDFRPLGGELFNPWE
jgi:hypothetical protein